MPSRATSSTARAKKWRWSALARLGLAAAAQLNLAGHAVTVFERDDAPGGLLRYGIPDFKLEKWVVDRRIRLMEEEGILVHCNAEVGKNVPVDKLVKEFDAIVLAGGSTIPRDLNAPGRDLKGVHFAMDFLKNQINGQPIPSQAFSAATNMIPVGKRWSSSAAATPAPTAWARPTGRARLRWCNWKLMPMPPGTSRTPNMPWPRLTPWC